MREAAREFDCTVFLASDVETFQLAQSFNVDLYRVVTAPRLRQAGHVSCVHARHGWSGIGSGISRPGVSCWLGLLR